MQHALVDIPSHHRELPLRQTAYERIVDRLNAGALRPGQIVSQRELVADTGTTLASVREAVSRLEAEGLLHTLPKRGLMVPSLDVDFVRNAYGMRRVIEMAAIPDMVARIDAATVAGWIAWHRDALARIDAGPDEALAWDVQRLDWAMHEAFVAAMGNALVANVYRVTAIKIRMSVQNRLQVTPLNARRVLAEHLDILGALSEGDVERLGASLGRHIDISLRLALGGAAE